MKLKERIANLERMDKMVRDFIADEDIQETWFCFYPAAATDSDKFSIASDDEDYNDIVMTFLQLMRQALE